MDERYPLITDPLPIMYEREAARNTGKGVIWHRPAERMTFTQIYEKVSYNVHHLWLFRNHALNTQAVNEEFVSNIVA